MQTLFQTYNRLVERINYANQRYLYDRINWNERLIGIKGARGVGKTTMILQHIRHVFPGRSQALYVSLDQLWFTQHTIIELAEYHYTHGGTHLFLDEVHRYPNWIRELKNIYDSYPDFHVVFTGSSLLELDNSVADLSRRCRMYEMRGLSFREYLKFEGVIDLPSLSLADILKNHVRYASSITGKIKILPYFEKFLSRGYYPFYKESEGDSFYERLRQVITTIIHEDQAFDYAVSRNGALYLEYYHVMFYHRHNPQPIDTFAFSFRAFCAYPPIVFQCKRTEVFG